MASEIVGGIEGGATNSTAVLINPEGKVIATVKTTGTNPYHMGLEQSGKEIEEILNKAKIQAGISLTTPLAALGLSLSGCEADELNLEMAKCMKINYPNLSLRYFVRSDTEGSIATVSNQGGMVCIAGTGSNTLLINPDGEKIQCGGWGYLLGDEGGAYHLSLSAIKYCIDVRDNFIKPEYCVDKIWKVIQEVYNIKTHLDLLEIFYQKFNKSHIAVLCKSLAELAKQGDDLARFFFNKAGIDLAKSIVAVADRASKKLTDKPGGLQIICVGSMWLSWDLLKSGFTNYLIENSKIDQLTLLRLVPEASGIGAAYMAADKFGLKCERDYSKNFKVFSTFNRCQTSNNS